MNRELEFRRLVIRAFQDAHASGKQDWRTMNLSVLKNRLLQQTHRQFRESDYGADSISTLVSRVPDLLSLETGIQPIVRFEIQETNQEFEFRAVSTLDSVDRNSSDVNDKTKFQELLDEYRANGDNLGVGETYATQLAVVNQEEVEKTLVNIVSRWASSEPVDIDLNNVTDLLDNIDRFVTDQLALAVVHANMRVEDVGRHAPPEFGDLHFRIANKLKAIYTLSPKSNRTATLQAAVAKTRETQAHLTSAVETFCQSSAVTAKLPSLEVIKMAHAYEPYSLIGERTTLREVEVLLGALFRKFCESCEKYEARSVPRRARDLQRQLQRTLESIDSDLGHRLRRIVLEPIATHMSRLIEEGTQVSDEMLSPSIEIAGSAFKLNLVQSDRNVVFPARIVNNGDGTAYSLNVSSKQDADGITLSLSDPAEPFLLAARSERLVQLSLQNIPGDGQPIEIDAVLSCETINERPLKFDHHFSFEQQGLQPKWDELINNPPYKIKAITDKKNLYGRDSILEDLEHLASNETSTFLWGQKRVGKTSVLQVLAANLAPRKDIVCIVLRMGELTSLHEGQLAHRIATRLVKVLSLAQKVPDEEEFGATMGKLIPFVEDIAQKSSRKMLVIIDEFDDLNSAFYIGERGKQFVKALRSLSEVGLTFMFVGSERMNSIYQRHSADLNKWINRSLDRIKKESDCETLIREPVMGMIEYEPEAIKKMIDYCKGNPFYMHLVAGTVFQRCSEEQRTFVGTSDFDYVRRSVVHELGPTNFAHFWEDVPVLDPSEKKQRVAENCLFLASVATLGYGGYESLEVLIEAQDLLGLEPHEQIPTQALREIEAELLRRDVLIKQPGSDDTEIALPVFSDWLLDNGERDLLPIWRSYRQEQATKVGFEHSTFEVVDSSSFPVDEDDLLPVSQQLIYLGQQKDVAEVRRWLRQFDDESRIEVAFLLLKRLAEKGFVTHGATVNGLAKMEESLEARRRDIGKGAWRSRFRRRLDNLYLGHVDSETKSGAATVRELAKRMNPGKCASIDGMGTWARAHLEDDPMLVVVDDFAGTGNTILKGLNRLWSEDEALFTHLSNEGRIVISLNTAFPEAITNVRQQYPKVKVLPITTFDSELKALSPEAKIFGNDAELAFAKDVMLQIGRQLLPQNPLGFGNMGALISFHNTIPNNTLPIFWCSGEVNGRDWNPLLPRTSSSS